MLGMALSGYARDDTIAKEAFTVIHSIIGEKISNPK